MSRARASETGDDAAERLAAEQARAALALSASDMGEYEWDVTADVFIVSPRMARITGIPVGALPAEGGEFALKAIHPDDIDQVRQTIAETLLSKARFDVTYRMIRPDDGRVLWMQSSAVILRGPGGPTQKLIGVVRDISARKAEESEHAAFVAELDHRVKNVLASVQSLAAQSARKTASLDTFLKTFFGRLEAMADAHTLLTQTRWRGAEIGDIAAAELAGLAMGRARWAGPDLLLNPRATNALTLALHELATNAVKFGALSVDTGRVDVTWAKRAEGGFELLWAERRGPPVGPPTRQGFGAMLLERVTGRELGGSVVVQYRPDGLRATIYAGDSALAAASDALVNGDRATADPTNRAQGGAPAPEQENRDIRGLKVLIVEDSVLLAVELETALTEAGAEVVGAAATIEEAIRLLERTFDVVLLDTDLNGCSSAPVAAALAARGKPFILATAHDDVSGFPEEATAPVVRKPYNVDAIATALTRATGRAG
jgi:PAS domain S-box-containing protein